MARKTMLDGRENTLKRKLKRGGGNEGGEGKKGEQLKLKPNNFCSAYKTTTK